MATLGSGIGSVRQLRQVFAAVFLDRSYERARIFSGGLVAHHAEGLPDGRHLARCFGLTHEIRHLLSLLFFEAVPADGTAELLVALFRLTIPQELSNGRRPCRG